MFTAIGSSTFSLLNPDLMVRRHRRLASTTLSALDEEFAAEAKAVAALPLPPEASPSTFVSPLDSGREDDSASRGYTISTGHTPQPIGIAPL